MAILPGYGLEGAIPDAIAKTIIEREIKPRLRQGDFAGGLTAGSDAILQAARGEYQGTRRIAGQRCGIVRVDWVYNPMPPTPQQIYPPLPLEPVSTW